MKLSKLHSQTIQCIACSGTRPNLAYTQIVQMFTVHLYVLLFTMMTSDITASYSNCYLLARLLDVISPTYFYLAAEYIHEIFVVI